jgi:hypothetical protein
LLKATLSSGGFGRHEKFPKAAVAKLLKLQVFWRILRQVLLGSASSGVTVVVLAKPKLNGVGGMAASSSSGEKLVGVGRFFFRKRFVLGYAWRLKI